MPNPHLVNLLKNFSPKEWKKFPAFLNSPFFTIKYREELKVLFPIIRKHCEKEPKIFPDLIHLWKQIKKDKPFHEVQMRNRLAELHNATKCFLAHYHYEKSEYFWITQLPYYTHHNLSHQFKTVQKELSKQQKEQPVKSEQDYFRAYEGKRWIDISKGKSAATFNRVQHLQAMLLDLDYSYLIGKLKQYCFLLSENKQAAATTPHISWFRTYLKQMVCSHQQLAIPVPPLFQIYYLLLLSMEDKTEETIQRLTDSFMQYGQTLSDRDKKNIEQHIVNFYMIKVGQNKKQYQHKLLDCYQRLQKSGFLVNKKGEINYRNYRNAVLTALQLAKEEKDTDHYTTWAKDFIEEYEHKIYPKIHANSIYHYLLGFWYAHQKNWVKAQNHTKKMGDLVQTISEEEHFCLWHHTLLLSILYEEGTNKHYFQKTLRKFYDSIRRTKILRKRTKNPYILFCKFILKMSHINQDKFKDKKKKAQILQEKIQQTDDPIAYKDWFLQKLTEMIHQK